MGAAENVEAGQRSTAPVHQRSGGARPGQRGKCAPSRVQRRGSPEALEAPRPSLVDKLMSRCRYYLRTERAHLRAQVPPLSRTRSQIGQGGWSLVSREVCEHPLGFTRETYLTCCRGAQKRSKSTIAPATASWFHEIIKATSSDQLEGYDDWPLPRSRALGWPVPPVQQAGKKALEADQPRRISSRKCSSR